MKPISILYFFIFLFISNLAFAQGENNIWCFGEHQGMDFNAGPPVLYVSNIFSQRGNATVCDPSGGLLFYSNSKTVWDRNHHPMPNGSALTGGTVITQGCAIIKSFADPNQYYVFHMSPNGKLYYAIVDMTLNLGWGDVVPNQKNVLIDSMLSEKMIVIGGLNCNWLLVHESSANKFHAFKVNAAGISPTPVISTSGFYNTTDAYKVGEMKVSPDYSMLALANNNNNTVELHSFSYESGTVSNAIFLDSATTGKVYGASFSPDGSKLYIGKNSGTGLFQYDVSLLPNVAAVQASLDTISSVTMGGMRIGPDNKIYVTEPYANLYVINDPNLSGAACNFAHLFGPYVKGNAFETDLGNPFIPTCPASYTVIDTVICYGTLPVTLSSVPGYAHYLWSDGTTAQTDTFTADGSKWVVAYNNHCDLHIDTFNVTLHLSSLTTTSKDTAACFVNNTPILSAPAGYSSYLWSDGFTQQSDTFSAAGTKWVTATQFNGCTVLVDTFRIQAILDTTRATRDTSLCVAYIPRVIAAPGGYTSYLWSDGTTQQSDTFLTTTTKTVRAQNGCNLLLEDVHFTATTIPQDSIFRQTTDSTICFEATPSITVNAPAGYTDYLWSDGVQSATNTFSNPGMKLLYAQKGCLALVDTFSIFSRMTDTVTHFADTTVCFAKQLILTATSGYLTYSWNSGPTTPAITINDNSMNWVAMHKACAERIDTFNVRLVNDLRVNLGEDREICKGDRVTLDATSSYPDATYAWQDNSINPLYTATNGGYYSVKVSVGECAVYDTVQIHEKTITVDLGDGKVPCGTTELILDPGVDKANYAWQDGNTSRTYKVTTDGVYSVQVTQGTCSTTASIHVTFEGCPCIVYIPSAFSPNKDGLNDFFGPTISCPVSGFEFRIFNRWGNMIFYTDQLSTRWDGSYKGTAQDNDLFYYYINFKDESGHNFYYKGDVTIVR